MTLPMDGIDQMARLNARCLLIDSLVVQGNFAGFKLLFIC